MPLSCVSFCNFKYFVDCVIMLHDLYYIYALNTYVYLEQHTNDQFKRDGANDINNKSSSNRATKYDFSFSIKGENSVNQKKKKNFLHMVNDNKRMWWITKKLELKENNKCNVKS